MSHNSYFTFFKKNISKIPLPQKFTFPFNYIPHPIAVIASEELQEYLLTQDDWTHDFGIDHYVEGTNIGKMFGVLVVKNDDGEIGYLSAFSGKLAGKNNFARFVPPIFDSLCKDGFYRKGESEIVEINKAISRLEKSAQFVYCKQKYHNERSVAEKRLADARQQMKNAKKKRDIIRFEAQDQMDAVSFAQLKERLKSESLRIQYDYKRDFKETQHYLATLYAEVLQFEGQIKALKNERKEKSAWLQRQLFEQFQFLNCKGEIKGVCDIFKETDLGVPPSGAGDCAAPKLLQYAFEHAMKPLAMAEFWWGQSPNSEIRRHKQYYPACRSKCEPILGHMLQGMQVDINPIDDVCTSSKVVEELYEDESILIINKPEEFLSVPGKNTRDCVYHRMRNKYPNAESPLVVHRLDMSTSGLMIIAKTKQAFVHIQKQFLEKTIKKRYVALLDGAVEGDSGIIELPLRVDLDSRPRQLVCYEYGKKAITQWHVVDRDGGKTRVLFYPLTGRTHQLRVHAAHPKGLNVPIMGDDLYGTKADRLYLHAEAVEFVHPTTNRLVQFVASACF